MSWRSQEGCTFPKSQPRAEPVGRAASAVGRSLIPRRARGPIWGRSDALLPNRRAGRPKAGEYTGSQKRFLRLMGASKSAPGASVGYPGIARAYLPVTLVAHVTNFDPNPRPCDRGPPSHALTEGARVCGGPLDLPCDPHHSCVVTSVRAWVGASVRRWWLGFSSITAERIRPPRPVGCTIDLARVSGEKLFSWMSTIFLLGSTS